MEFSRREYWSGLPFPTAGDVSDPGILPEFPALAAGFFTTSTNGKPYMTQQFYSQTILTKGNENMLTQWPALKQSTHVFPIAPRRNSPAPYTFSPQLQQFNYTWLRLIKHGAWCLAPVPDNGALRLHLCDNRNKGLRWLHKSTSVFRPELVSKIFVPLPYHKSNFPLNAT